MLTIFLRLVTLPLFTLLLAVIWVAIAKTETQQHANHSHFAYPEALTGAYTGGFTEETCRSCHFDYNLNPPGGSLAVNVSSPVHLHLNDRRYSILISVKRAGLGAAGFQLTARYPDGTQAGAFDINDHTNVQLTPQISDSIHYVQHSGSGFAPKHADSTSWNITWIAPATLTDTVVLNIAANAANGDQSEFGDWIYSRKIILPTH